MASESLERVFRGRIPLSEVSGLDCSVGAAGAVLAAIGDTRASLATAPVGADGSVGEWAVLTTADLGARPGAEERFTQLEAVALDGAGIAWVLTEGTSSLAGVDLGARKPVAAVALDATTIDDLHASWSDSDASRGEGLLLLADGHVLVAKEKDPAGLVEFGPAGDEALGVTADSVLARGAAFGAPVGDLVALAWWPLSKQLLEDFEDLSDLAPGEDGSVWVLSDQSRRLGRLRLPLAPGGPVVVQDAVDLPKKTGKPEGLAFLPSGLIAVADDHDEDGDNLWVFALPHA